MTLTEAEKGYIAGIIDGEGYVSMQKSGDTIFPVIIIANTKKDLIDWLETKTETGNVKKHTPKNPNYNTCYRIYWYNDEAIRLLKLTYDFLILKKKQARALIRLYNLGHRLPFQNGYYGYSRHFPPPSWLLDARLKTWKLCKQLNSRTKKLEVRE